MWERLRVRFVSESGSKSVHAIYCRKHAVRQSSSELPQDRTLFCAGWPPYATQDGVRDVFARVGQVTSVCLQKQPTSGRPHAAGLVSYVVFSERSEAESALKLCSSSQPVHCTTGPVGLAKWARQYQNVYRKERLLEAEVEAEVGEYDLWVKQDAERKRSLAQPDEEGWITVTGRTASTRKSSTQQKRKELTNFYTFQQRDRQRMYIAQLRKKFEADKKKVAELRAQRKFRPF